MRRCGLAPTPSHPITLSRKLCWTGTAQVTTLLGFAGHKPGWPPSMRIISCHSLVTCPLCLALQVRPLVDALVVRTRERTSELLARAYSVLPLAKAASLLGSSEADTLALAQAAGWEYDASSSMLAPREAAGVGAEPDSSAALQQLSNYMLHLEA